MIAAYLLVLLLPFLIVALAITTGIALKLAAFWELRLHARFAGCATLLSFGAPFFIFSHFRWPLTHLLYKIGINPFIAIGIFAYVGTTVLYRTLFRFGFTSDDWHPVSWRCAGLLALVPWLLIAIAVLVLVVTAYVA